MQQRCRSVAFQQALALIFLGLIPVDGKAMNDVMLHFSGEAALTQTSKSLWLAVSPQTATYA
jgi:hypothetical protein